MYRIWSMMIAFRLAHPKSVSCRRCFEGEKKSHSRLVCASRFALSTPTAKSSRRVAARGGPPNSGTTAAIRHLHNFFIFIKFNFIKLFQYFNSYAFSTWSTKRWKFHRISTSIQKLTKREICKNSAISTWYTKRWKFHFMSFRLLVI